MMVFKKAIPRRTVLRGMNAILALPLLDGMIPAFASPSDTNKAPVRFGIVYVPNGMWPMDKWTPKREGSGFDLSPTLEPLTPFRDQLLVLSGLAQNEANPGAHSTAMATFLTGVRPKPSSGHDLQVGISVDQIAAGELGKKTQLRSLEVGLFLSDLVGTCEPGYACTYLTTPCWRTSSTPLPMENNPRAVFERLFGDSDSTDPNKQLALFHKQRSILDWVGEDLGRLVNEITPSDRAKLNEFLDAIRDIERRIQVVEERSSQELPTFERPAGIPVSFDEYAKLMIDLQVLAFQTDLTRVITFMMGHEGPYGSRAYPEIGISDLHHALSHHQNDPAAIDKLFKINFYHTQLFAYFLEKLRATPDGDGNLLDHSMLLYGSALSNGNIHEHINLPILLAGQGAGRLKGNRHIRYPEGTPMTNLYVTMLEKLGLSMDKLGDSTGALDLLSV